VDASDDVAIVPTGATVCRGRSADGRALSENEDATSPRTPRLADENDDRINFRNHTGALDRHP